MANLYWCWYDDVDEFGCLVVEETAQKGKVRFRRTFKGEYHGDFVDIRVKLVEKHVPHPVGCYEGLDRSEAWTDEYYCKREWEECNCRACREERAQEGAPK